MRVHLRDFEMDKLRERERERERTWNNVLFYFCHAHRARWCFFFAHIIPSAYISPNAALHNTIHNALARVYRENGALRASRNLYKCIRPYNATRNKQFLRLLVHCIATIHNTERERERTTIPTTRDPFTVLSSGFNGYFRCFLISFLRY